MAEAASLACPICFDQYEAEGLKAPRSLACGHALCEACLLKLASTSKREITCPNRCEAKTKLTRDGINSIPKNWAVIGMITEKKDAKPTSPSICEGNLKKRPTK